MRAVLIYFWMILCICNILFGFFIIASNFRKASQLSLQQFSYVMAIICAMCQSSSSFFACAYLILIFQFLILFYFILFLFIFFLNFFFLNHRLLRFVS